MNNFWPRAVSRFALRAFLLIAMGAAWGPGISAAVVPGVGFEQCIGQSIPRDLRWRDTDGLEAPLGHWLRGRATVVWFGYARCPQLCSVIADGMVSALRQLQPSAGVDFDVVMMSIDPKETRATASAARTEAVGHYGRTGAGAGWTYLTGTEDTIRATADAAGFRYTYDPRSDQYAHASGCLVLTPEGKISAYLIGLDFAPKDLAGAIARANRNDFGQKVADLLLVCFRGDGISGRYGTVIWRSLGAAVFLTIAALSYWIGRMLWLERKTLRLEREGEG